MSMSSAATPSPTDGPDSEAGYPAAPPSNEIDLFGELRKRFSLGPANWDFFKAKTAEAAASPGAAVDVPESGANVTLQDLSRPASSIRPWPDQMPPNAVPFEELDSEAWVGMPDPEKYGPRTTYLSLEQLQEEAANGNMVTVRAFREGLAAMSPEEQRELMAELYKRTAQEQLFVTLQDGAKVSLWDLLQYVNNNPEMAALARSGRHIPVVDPADPAGAALRYPEASPAERQAGQQMVAVGQGEADDLNLDWGKVAEGAIWKRRPTRWLKGIDGVRDWDVEVYDHEVMTNAVLGRKYGARRALQVAADDEYKSDVLRVGPLLGMTFVLRAARDIPLQEVASSWSSRLQHYLRAQAQRGPAQVPRRLRETVEDYTDLNGPTWARSLLQASSAPGRQQQQQQQQQQEDDQGFDELGISWRRLDDEEHKEALEEGLQYAQALHRVLIGPGSGSSSSSAPGGGGLLHGSRILDERGRVWLRGSELMVTLGPEGAVMLQAQSPGVLREQQSLLLGTLHNEAVCGAVMDMMMGPQPLDPEMADAARNGMLLHVYGYTSGNTAEDPNHPVVSDPVRLPKMPANPRRFALGRVGAPPAGTLLNDIGTVRTAYQINDLLREARQAADQARSECLSGSSSSSGSGAGKDEQAPSSASGVERAEAAARSAGQRVLRRGLSALGPAALALLQQYVPAAAQADGGGSGGAAPNPVVQDLFSLARILDAREG